MLAEMITLPRSMQLPERAITGKLKDVYEKRSSCIDRVNKQTCTIQQLLRNTNNVCTIFICFPQKRLQFRVHCHVFTIKSVNMFELLKGYLTSHSV